MRDRYTRAKEPHWNNRSAPLGGYKEYSVDDTLSVEQWDSTADTMKEMCRIV